MRNFAHLSRILARRALPVAMAMMIPATASFAFSGDDEQRSACMPDVFRLCSSEIPSIDRIVACLRKEKPNLSAGCQAAFNRPYRETATRSLATPEPEIEWCGFGRVIDPSQDNWLKWCGSSAHTQ